MSDFDRDFQLRILDIAINDYPNTISVDNITPEFYSVSSEKLLKNIAYLCEENLITGGIVELLSGKQPALNLIKATKDAINLLSEEGSLSASLKIVTVKLHDDSLAVIRDFIDQNVTDPDERKT